jgi:translation initiation factor eIF-2B subunit epsilon
MGKHQKSGSSADDLVKREPELQAVLLADSFTRTFRPLSFDKSKVLCPLNNVTMLDYTLEFLAGAGVHQVIVVCTRDDVEEHLSRCKLTGELKVVCLKDASLTNAGDALREVDKKNLVQSNPFILMGGDVVTNVDLTNVIETHKQRYKKDNSAIMTVLFQKVGPQTHLRPPTSDLVVGMDPRNSRILVYDDHALNGNTSIPCSFFASHAEVELHDDLLDVGFYICSPQVLARFSDEFDYRDIRREFITNTVAEEEEGLQHKLFGEVLSKQDYAARIFDFHTYHAVSKDLLRRWCYPVVPDNLPNGYETMYRYALQRHYLYKEQRQPTKVGPSTTIIGPGMVGSNNGVGRGCRIVGTVIGHDCWIGDGVTMKDSHLWEQVTVEEGATVVESILADNVVIRQGATVSRGCIVGSGCIIGANVILPEFTRITKSVDTDGDDDAFGAFGDDSSQDWSTEDVDGDDDDSSSEDEEEPQGATDTSDHDVVGPDGIGRVWKPTLADEDDEDEEDEMEDPMELIKAQSIGYDTASWFHARRAQHLQGDTDDLSDDDDSLGADFSSEFDDALTFSTGPASNVDQHGASIVGRQRGVDVVKELKEICMEHEGAIENLAIELNSFKFSQNATYSDCTMAAMLAVLDKMAIDESMSAGKLVTALKSQLEKWGPLFQKMSIGLDEEKSIVLALEMAATTGEDVAATVLSKEPAFRFLLQTLHDEELVSEEAILSWAAERREEAQDTPRGKLFHQQPTQDFLEWLEEESDDEDESSDEEGSD